MEERGLTLIEVLVATFLIGVALVPLFQLYPGTLGFNVDSSINARLSAAAVRKMEDVIRIVRGESGVAVTLDSSTGVGWPSAAGATSTGALTISPSANYVLIVIGNETSSTTVSSVTVGGAAAARIAWVNQSSALRGELWGILSPPTGTQVVTVTLTSARNHAWVAASFIDVSSATPLGGNVTNSGSSSTPNASLASRTPKSLLVGGFSFDDQYLTTSEGAGQTRIGEGEVNSASTQMSREISVGSAGNGLDWTVHQGDRWAALIVELRSGPAAGSSSGTEACSDVPNCLLVWSTTTELSGATPGRLDQVSVVACQDTDASNTCDAGERQVRYDAKVTTRP